VLEVAYPRRHSLIGKVSLEAYDNRKSSKSRMGVRSSRPLANSADCGKLLAWFVGALRSIRYFELLLVEPN
jgi:hypothetical protein